MKTKYEFRKKALDFAKRDEFEYDSVAVKGLYEDYEVYMPYCKAWKNNPPMIGLPQIILVNDRCKNSERIIKNAPPKIEFSTQF